MGIEMIEVPWTEDEVCRWFGEQGEAAVTEAFTRIPQEQLTDEVFEALKFIYEAGIDAAALLTSMQNEAWDREQEAFREV